MKWVFGAGKRPDLIDGAAFVFVIKRTGLPQHPGLQGLFVPAEGF